MNKSVGFFVLGLLTPILAAVLFIVSGGMPVATKGPPLPFEEKIAHLSIKARMGNQDSVISPVPENAFNLSQGAKVYSVTCSMCHGALDGKVSAIAAGLYPKPPQLFSKDESVTDDSAGKIFWFIKNGIRLTGMPGFVDSLSDEKMWQVALLLKNADQLDENVKKEIKQAKD